MIIRLFIVTYRNAVELNKTLTSLYSNIGKTKAKLEINIINNHSNFSISPEFNDRVKVLNNVLRPDFSTGYLSRNWNQALILGFENLIKPVCDIVIACQDDTVFYENWVNKLIGLHKKYSFITFGWGDNFMSWVPEAVKRIGIFDERFVFGGVAAEYFMRALIFNKKKSTINDYFHRRLLNTIDISIADRPDIPIIHKKERKMNRLISYALFRWKFPGLPFRDWEEKFVRNSPIKYGSYNYVLYPYFEKDVETLNEQNYVGYSNEFKDLKEKYLVK